MCKKIAAIAALMIASSSAFAVEPGALYAGVDIGKTKIDDWSDRETSYGGFVGYKFHPNFAAEFGYRRLGDAEAFGADIKVDQASLSLIGSLPLGNNFDLYGRLGYNRLEADAKARGITVSESESRAVYGVGVSYAFTPAISARIEAQKPASEFTNYSAGIVFKF